MKSKGNCNSDGQGGRISHSNSNCNRNSDASRYACVSSRYARDTHEIRNEIRNEIRCHVSLTFPLQNS